MMLVKFIPSHVPPISKSNSEIGIKTRWFSRSYRQNYTVSQKNVLTLKRYSSKLQGAILMKFGRSIQNTLE